MTYVANLLTTLSRRHAGMNQRYLDFNNSFFGGTGRQNNQATLEPSASFGNIVLDFIIHFIWAAALVF